MKSVLLAGGLGSRISEESHLKPKPMIEIGGKPILWHIMKMYTQHNITEFVICLGYKSYMIKEYFANYFLHTSDVTWDMSTNEMQVHHRTAEPWKVTLVETGEKTMTGGRLKRVAEYVQDGTFCFTYGDGVADVDLTAVINAHKSGGRLATVTALQPAGRFGALRIESDQVLEFQEKPAGDGAWINGGFFVLEPEVIDYIEGDDTIWEQLPLQKLAADRQLTAYKHEGFWQPMDTLRERILLQDLWDSGNAPWKTWE